MSRRIAHVVELSRGGPTTVVLDLFRHQRARGDTPLLIACRNLITPELAEESRTDLLYESARNPARVPGVVREIAPLIDRAKADILHLHSTFPGLYGRLALSRLTGPRPKVVYSPHGWAFTQDVPALKARAYALVERWLLPRTDAIINPSYFEAEAARRFGLLCGNDHAIPNGVPPAKNVAAKDLGLDPARINLAFFGRFDRQKGLDLLVRALNRTAVPELHLTVVGSRLRGDEPEPDWGEKVARLDWVPPSEIDAHMKAFDMIVVPSRWEAFGLVSAEAMRNGVPVLVSNRGALKELVIDGFNGLVFDMDDPRGLEKALERLPGLDLIGMGRNARAVFESACVHETRMTQIDRVYGSLLGSRDGDRAE
jgi:glycosyltransferase involved in cell wall biosynthesis